MTGGQTSPPAVVNGYVYFGSDDKSVYCLNASSSTILWKYAINVPQITFGSIINGPTLDYSPAVDNGVVYTSFSMAYSNSSEGNVPVGTLIAIAPVNNLVITPTASSHSTITLINQNLELITFIAVLAIVLVLVALLFIFRRQGKIRKGRF